MYNDDTIKDIYFYLNNRATAMQRESAINNMSKRYRLTYEEANEIYSKWREEYCKYGYAEKYKEVLNTSNRGKFIYTKSINKETLANYYVDRKYSANKIAKEFNVSLTVIYDKLNEFNIPLRKKRISDDVLSKEKLHELSVVKKMTYNQIAEIFDCNPCVIRRRIERYNLN